MQFRHTVSRSSDVKARLTAAARRCGVALITASAAVFATAPGARADVTVTYSVSADSAQIRQALAKATPQQRAQMEAHGIGKPTVSIFYAHGGTMRQDDGPQSRIIDIPGHKITMLDRNGKRYLDDSFTLKPFVPSSTGAPATSVTATGKTASLLGHSIAQYTFSVRAAKGPQSMSGEIWAAADLTPLPFDPLTNNPSSPFAAQMKKVKGLPLKIIVHMNQPNGMTTITQVATAVSKAQVAASQFVVPSGFTRVQPPPSQAPGGLQPSPAPPAHP